MNRFRVTFTLLPLGLLGLSGCAAKRIQVEPNHVTLPLDQSVAVTATLSRGSGHQPISTPVEWHAYNIERRQEFPISARGVFTAQLPGRYRIVAKTHHATGKVVIRVPKGLSRDPNEAPLSTAQVSWRGYSGTTAPPTLPQPQITGPGWRDDNLGAAFDAQSRRGHIPFHIGGPTINVHNPRMHRLSAAEINWGIGKGDYVLTIPILNLPGRGLSTNLNLVYNSQLWREVNDNSSVSGYAMVFDHEHGWPAAGWSLGFGRVVQVGSVGAALEDADGTLHLFAGSISAYSIDNLANVHTTDGTLIDGSFSVGTNSCLSGGSAQYPNGTTVTFGAANSDCSSSEGGAAFPTSIIDANGNVTTITYVNNRGPAIQTIEDTLGRVITFHYDSNLQLIAITVPGLGGQNRTVVRFTYSPLVLQYNFRPEYPAIVWNQPQKLDGIYFPGDSTGYWFGDTDSYSPYGMIAKVSERRGMTLQSNSLSDQGVISEGITTRERVYDYPQNTSGDQLFTVPYYTQLTETWDGIDTYAVVTHFHENYFFGQDSICQGDYVRASSRDIETDYPDGSVNHLMISNDLQDFAYGLPYCEVTLDGSTMLRRVVTHWEQGDYDSPRVQSRDVHDSLDQTLTTQYAYDGYGSPRTNQLLEVQEKDYDGNTIARRTDTFPETNGWYLTRHIFNLAKTIVVTDGTGHEVSRTEYEHDNQPLTETPGVVGHSEAFDPQSPPVHYGGYTKQKCTYESDGSGHRIPDCVQVDVPAKTLPIYDPATDYRGNVTKITRYTDAQTHGEPIAEDRRYDVAGNLLTTSGACCEQTSYKYTVATQYAYPEMITHGAVDQSSTTRVNQSFHYDFSTGLIDTTWDSNNLSTKVSYDPGSLRPTQVLLPTTAKTIYSYDDSNLSITTTLFDSSNKMASHTVTHVNGLRLVEQEETTAPDGAQNAVTRKYDALGRLWQQSQPYRLGQQPLFNQFSYDPFNRVTTMQRADGSTVRKYYNEANRPSSASSNPGQTVRIVDSVGRERWLRTEALGQLAEVVEPDASGDGTLNWNQGKNNSETTYKYNVLGLLVEALQAQHQERDFQYDSLGRMTAQRLPEKSAYLNDSGAYDPTHGRWSDVYTYDQRSNLQSHTDARGVTTTFNYYDDPLNRLQHVTYTNTTGDDTIIPAPAITYRYVATGDMTRVSQIELDQNGQKDFGLQRFGYDQFGRLSSKTMSFGTEGPPPLEIDYRYDSLNRIVGEVYPAEYGTAEGSRRLVDYRFGTAGAVVGLKVDGVDQASNVQYNPAGQTTSIVVGPSGPEQTTDTYVYDPATLLLKSERVLRGTSSLLSLDYSYSPAQQLLTLLNNQTQAESRSYVYDAIGRLVSVSGGNAKEPDWTQTYDYDLYGNRSKCKTQMQDGRPCPDKGVDDSGIPRDGLELTFDPASNHVSLPGFTYDAAGNQTRAQRVGGSWVNYRYDAAGRLSQTRDENGNILEVDLYGADARKIAQASGQNSTDITLFAWDGHHIISEYKGKGAPRWSRSRFYLGDRLLADFEKRSSGEITSYFHPDQLGIHLITNNADNTAIEQTTLPFGTLIPGKSDNPVNPVFTTYDRSRTSEIDDAINRNYDCQQRFLEPDPTGMLAVSLIEPQTLNLYTYVEDDPLNKIDSSGLVPDGPIGIPPNSQDAKAWGDAVIGGVAGFVAGGPVGAAAGAAAGYYTQRYNDTVDNVVALNAGSPVAALDWNSPGPFITSTTTDPTTNSWLDLTSGWISSESVTTTLTESYGSVLAGTYSQAITTIQATNYSDGRSTIAITAPDGTVTVTTTNDDGSFKVVVQDANGVITSSNSYDASGNQISSPTGGDVAGGTSSGNGGKCKDNNCPSTQ